MREQRQRERDREAERHRDRDQHQVLEGRGRHSDRSCRRSQPAQKPVVLACSRPRAVAGRSRSLPPRAPTTGRSAQLRRGDHASGRSAAECSSVRASSRGEELRDDLDRQHAGDPPLRRRPPARSGSRPGAGRRARRASRRRARASAPAGVRAAGTTSAAQVASESQPSGRRSESTSSACGTSAPSSFARDLDGRLADERERRLPELDVAHPEQRQPLQRPVGADEVLHEVVGGGHQQLGRRRVLGEPPPFGGRRSGRPS